MVRRAISAITLVALMTLLGASEPPSAQAGATGPPHVRYTGGQGVLPSGETFSFSVGLRWDGVVEGWLAYQRPGWRQFTSTKITSVWVNGQNEADVWGEGQFAPAPPVTFHMVVTGNQTQAGGRDVFRIRVWPGADTPEASSALELVSGQIRVSKASGLQFYSCGRRFVSAGNPYYWIHRAVHAWVYYDGVAQQGVPTEAWVVYEGNWVGRLGFNGTYHTDAGGYVGIYNDSYPRSPLASNRFVLAVWWQDQWLYFPGQFWPECNPWLDNTYP